MINRNFILGILIFLGAPLFILGEIHAASIGLDRNNSSHIETVIVGIPFEIPLPPEARDVVIGDPLIIDSVITAGKKLVLTGKSQGATTVTVSDRSGSTLFTLPIRVSANLDDLNEVIHRDLGLTAVIIRILKQAIVIGGSVPSPADADRVVELVRAYFGIGASADGAAAGIRIVNTLKITERDQVMLRVVVSEVQRSLLKQLGVDTQGNWSIGDFTFANASTFPTTRVPTSTFSPGVSGSDKGGATLKALERSGYLKTLAEPMLTAISGESAKFTAGGEIPVPTGDICSTNALGIQSCQTNYGYKPIGVTLSFTPVVLNSGRISLHINTEVTEIDPDNGSRTSSANIPAFRSRKMETTVELASGAALMSAGLIQQQSSSTFDRVPGIAMIPILGQLFQSNDYQNQQTELLISVVPYIAQPSGPLEPDASDTDFMPPVKLRQSLIKELSLRYQISVSYQQPKFGFEVP